jgi:hypothetical protein
VSPTSSLAPTGRPRRGGRATRRLVGCVLVVMAALLVALASAHGPASRAMPHAVADRATDATPVGPACRGDGRCAPRPDGEVGDVDCPPTACVAVLPRPGEPEGARMGVHRRPEWPAPGPAVSRGGGRVERPPRVA